MYSDTANLEKYSRIQFHSVNGLESRGFFLTSIVVQKEIIGLRKLNFAYIK